MPTPLGLLYRLPRVFAVPLALLLVAVAGLALRAVFDPKTV